MLHPNYTYIHVGVVVGALTCRLENDTRSHLTGLAAVGPIRVELLQTNSGPEATPLSLRPRDPETGHEYGPLLSLDVQLRRLWSV